MVGHPKPWRTEDLFPLGGPMPAQQLVGRSVCVSTLATRLANGAHTAVPGNRKAGKTSACRAAMARAAATPKLLPIAVDLYEVEDEDGFLNAIHDATVSAVAGRAAPAISAAGRLLPRLARLGIGDIAGELNLEGLLDLPSQGRARMEATLRLPQEAARLWRGRTALLIDEAQRLGGFSAPFRRMIHGALRDSNNVTLLLTGGDGELMDNLFVDPLGPITALVLHRHVLAPVSDKEWREGLRRLFALDECRIDDAALDLVIEEGKQTGVTSVHSTIAIAHHTHLQARLDETDHITAGVALRGYETAAYDLERLTEAG
jgi:hypothetical protein